MEFRTDLALEQREELKDLPEGVACKTTRSRGATVTRIAVTNEAGARALHKPVGKYITIELPPFSDYIDDENRYAPVIAKEIVPLLESEGLVLVAGLGNEEITPDAIGPLAAKKILATRHLTGELARVSGLDQLRRVAAVAPGVLGQTGIESAEMLKSLVKQLAPSCVIVIDAFAARSLSRLGNTVQIADVGISPGSGVENARPQLSRETLGVPVISLGVPTVVDGATLVVDLFEGDEHSEEELRGRMEPRGTKMIVTPREIDLIVQRAAKMAALAVNCALQPSLSAKEVLMLLG